MDASLMNLTYEDRALESLNVEQFSQNTFHRIP